MGDLIKFKEALMMIQPDPNSLDPINSQWIVRKAEMKVPNDTQSHTSRFSGTKMSMRSAFSGESPSKVSPTRALNQMLNKFSPRGDRSRQAPTTLTYKSNNGDYFDQIDEQRDLETGSRL